MNVSDAAFQLILDKVARFEVRARNGAVLADVPLEKPRTKGLKADLCGTKDVPVLASARAWAWAVLAQDGTELFSGKVGADFAMEDADLIEKGTFKLEGFRLSLATGF